MSRSQKNSSGVKYDSKKLRWDLLPIEPIIDVVRVLSHGARKYADDNWRRVANPKERYYAATMRHIIRWRQGFRRDKGSGRSHLAHAICCLIFLWVFDNQKGKKQ